MPELAVQAIAVSPFQTNCYLASDVSTGDAVIIDPGDEAEVIVNAVRSAGLTVRAIINTHGHADHIAANGAMKNEFRCPIMIHELEVEYLSDPDLNLASFIGHVGPISPPADRLLADGDEIVAGNLRFTVLHTPGHTPGGICLSIGDALFAGDTLFAGSIGRSDFPGGSHRQLLSSIREKLLLLPDETIVYPGHGCETTIGVERATNPWL